MQDTRDPRDGRSYFVGVDLGQVAEPTAIVVVEADTLPYEIRDFGRHGSYIPRPVFFLPGGKETRDHPPVSYSVRHIERLTEATYSDVVNEVRKLEAQLKPKSIAVDATGVGRAAVDLFREIGDSMQPITITAGDAVTKDPREYRIPKRDLATTAQVLLQGGRLKIARSLREGELLASELQSFRVKVDLLAARDAMAAWREGVNDDLVLALCIALWIAEDQNGGVPVCTFSLIARRERTAGIF
jgi:hypothetical protein